MLNVNVVWKHNKISRVDLGLDGKFAFGGCLEIKLTSNKEKESCQRWLDHYLRCEKAAFPFELDLSSFSPFVQKVLLTLKKIPFGETRTYGEIAQMVGHPGAARAVGSACSKNPYPLFIPCHRVVAKGGLGGFFLPIEIKQLLLGFESALCELI